MGHFSVEISLPPGSVLSGNQHFNAVNQMRLLGRWMRMLTIPNPHSPSSPLISLS